MTSDNGRSPRFELPENLRDCRPGMFFVNSSAARKALSRAYALLHLWAIQAQQPEAQETAAADGADPEELPDCGEPLPDGQEDGEPEPAGEAAGSQPGGDCGDL